MESDDRDITTSTQNLAIRDSAPPQSSRTFDGSHAPSWSSGIPDVSRYSSGDVWAGAISRIQAQVSLNTSMLESHRRQLQEVEINVRNLDQQIGNAFSALNEMRNELRTRPSAPPSSRHDAGDLEVLAGQVEAITYKANEVDGLKMQLDLLKNRMKRWEEQGGPVGPNGRPGTSSSHQREPSIHELPPQSYLDRPPHHQPLPPMRTTSISSPIETRTAGILAPHGHPPVPILESQAGPRYPLPSEPRQYSVESSRTMQPSSGSSFRPSEPLPPPSSLPGWRSSDSLHHPSGGPSSNHSRPQTMEPEPNVSGWASVNANQTAKRPFEEPRRSPYESPRSGSPKRPKLAPIMPRSSYGDDSYMPSGMTPSGTGESSLRPGSRATSDVSQPPSRTIPTPDSASNSSYRFITSTAQADSQESWRPEQERRGHLHHHHHQPGRNRGRRGGRGQGRRGRGGGVQLPESQQFGTPEWEKSEWTGSQISSNGYYHPLHPYSPRAGRGGLIRRGGGGAGGPGGPSDREADFPETPIQGSEDPTAEENLDNGLHPASGGKKTRTKPIRNAEGVLIRKDGRPDMRSVSSANNLRKVHAKKEAERAEMEGRTPTSARSLAPADTYSDDEDENHSVTPGTPAERDEAEDDGRHTNEELMSRIYPRGIEHAETVAETYFPSTTQQAVPDARMKTEEAEEPQTRQGEQSNGNSQMTDVEMREMSDAQAEEQRYRQDTKMETVDEASEERERGSEAQEAEQSAERSVE